MCKKIHYLPCVKIYTNMYIYIKDTIFIIVISYDIMYLMYSITYICNT